MTTNITKILIGLITLALASCTTVPLPKQQNIAIPKKTRGGLKIEDGLQDFSHVMWWKKMHDPVLNQLITEALINNNQLHTARANILQAQAVLKEARFSWVPSLKASGSGILGRTWDSHFTPQGALVNSPALSKLGAIHFQGIFSGFVPSYSLNILENLSKTKYAKASLVMQKAVYNATRLSVISQITGSYFMLLGQKAQRNAQMELISDLNKVYRLESIRFKDGASDLSAITNLEQQIATYQASLASLENSISQIENAIQLLINQNPAPITTGRNINTLSTKGLIPANLPSAVLKNRPDVIIAEAELKMADANIGIAYSSFFPAISLTGLLGHASLDLSNLLKLRTGLFLADAGLAIPVFNGVAYEQINAAKAGYSASYFSYVQTIRSVFSDVNNSLTNQQKMNEAYHSQLKSYRATKNAYRLASSTYKSGYKDYRVVANAQLNVDYAKLNLILAKMQQLDSMVEVYQALAGGYQTKP